MTPTNRTTAELREAFIVTSGGDGQGQSLATSREEAAKQAISMMWCGSLESALEDEAMAVIYNAIMDPSNEDWCSEQITFSFEDGWLSVLNITQSLNESGLALLPQPPALGGIVQEIDGLFESWRAAGDSYVERKPLFDKLSTTLIRDYPTLRANLKQEEWQDISTAPKDGTDVLITSWNTAKWADGVDRSYWQTQTARFINGHWVTESYPDSQYGYMEVEYITAHASGPTHWQPLPTPPQSKKEG